MIIAISDVVRAAISDAHGSFHAQKVGGSHCEYGWYLRITVQEKTVMKTDTSQSTQQKRTGIVTSSAIKQRIKSQLLAT